MALQETRLALAEDEGGVLVGFTVYAQVAGDALGTGSGELQALVRTRASI